MSADRILQKIKEDAQQEADAIYRAAEERAASIGQAVLQGAEQKAAKIAADVVTESEEIDRRKLLIAGLEARKNTLAAKRAVLDEAFRLALEELCSLQGQRWEKLITRLVLESSSTGEEKLRVPAADRSRYSQEFLDSLNTQLKAAGKKGALTLDDQPASFSGGFQLIGKISDVNASFEALVRAAREDCEREVSALLFEAEVQ